MNPTSLVLDFLQNGIRRFRTRFETTADDNRQVVKNRDAAPLAKAKVKYAGAILTLLGIGLLGIAAFLKEPSSTGAFTAQETESPALTCNYMAVSLFPGGKLSAEVRGADEADSVRCTATMLETSSATERRMDGAASHSRWFV